MRGPLRPIDRYRSSDHSRADPRPAWVRGHCKSSKLSGASTCRRQYSCRPEISTHTGIISHAARLLGCALPRAQPATAWLHPLPGLQIGLPRSARHPQVSPPVRTAALGHSRIFRRPAESAQSAAVAPAGRATPSPPPQRRSARRSTTKIKATSASRFQHRSGHSPERPDTEGCSRQPEAHRGGVRKALWEWGLGASGAPAKKFPSSADWACNSCQFNLYGNQ